MVRLLKEFTMIEDVNSHRRKSEHDDSKTEDSELLRLYAEAGSQDAFAELVRRRIGLVYSVALRQTRGDAHRAQDATQAVFTDLARKAHLLARRPVLAGWLYRSAQFAAAGLIRAEQRRHVREQEAHTMETIAANDDPEMDWNKVRPVLDQALNEMDEPDRDAILLRFFDGRSFVEIGQRLRFTESAARMRVERALDKLNASLSRRGITSTSAALGVALAHQIGAATPAGLAASVTGAALAGTAASAGGWLAIFMNMTNLQIGIASAVAIAGVTGYAVQANANTNLRREIASLRPEPQAIATLRTENQRLASLVAEVETLRRDDAELARLAQSVAEARKAGEETARLARLRENDQRKAQDVKAEIERMNREGNALVEDYKALMTRSKDLSLPEGDRANAEAAAKLKIAAIQAKQREIKAYIESTGGPTPLQFQPRGEGRLSLAKTPESGPAAPWPGEIAFQGRPVRDAFTTYEKISGVKVVLDASLADIQGTLDLHTGPSTKEVALQALRAALHDQANIILEPTNDGRMLARRGPPR
jgi:RNA polymerase sigma factor (sigma-70 family)